MSDVIHRAATEAIQEAYAGGSARVAVRGFTGMGVAAVAAGVLVATSAEGACLVVAPQVMHHQVRAEIARMAPGLSVGDWESGCRVEVATPFKASVMAHRRASARSPEVCER